MSLRILPPHVRAHLYLFWVGMGLAGIGVLGFVFSFWRVGSAAQAAVDVHTDVPVVAYVSIVAWVVGLAVMWYSRRALEAAVAARTRETRAAMYVDTDDTSRPARTDTIADAPAARDA